MIRQQHMLDFSIILVLAHGRKIAQYELLNFCCDLVDELPEVPCLVLIGMPSIQRTAGCRVVITKAPEFRRPQIQSADGQFVHWKMSDYRG